MRVPICLGRLVLGAASWLLLSGFTPDRVDVTQPSSVGLVDSRAIENLPVGPNRSLNLVTGPFAAVTSSGFTLFDPTVYNGQSFDTRTVASDGHTLAFGGSDGLLTVDLGTGTKTFYDIPSAKAIVFGDSDGSVVVGLEATAPAQSLILRCKNGQCFPSSSGPASLKAGDFVDGFTVVPGAGTYAYGTSFFFAADNKTFQYGGTGLLAGPYHGVSCANGSCVVTGEGGLGGGTAGGTSWIPITGGFPTGTYRFTGVTANNFGWVANANVNFNVSYAQPYTSQGFDWTKPWSATPQLDGGLVLDVSFLTKNPAGETVVGTNWGAYRFDGSSWRSFNFGLNSPEVSSLDLYNGGLYSGGNRTYPSLNFSGNGGRTWNWSSLLNTDVGSILNTPSATLTFGRDGARKVSSTGSASVVAGFPSGSYPTRAAQSADGRVVVGSSTGSFYLFNSGLTAVMPYGAGISGSTDPITFVLACGNTFYGFSRSQNWINPNGTWQAAGLLVNGSVPWVGSGYCLDGGGARFGGRGTVFDVDPMRRVTLRPSAALPTDADLRQLIRIGTAYSFLRTGREPASEASLATVMTNVAATSRGLYASVDDGGTWFLVSHDLGTSPVSSVAADATHLYVGTSNFGLVVYALPMRFRRLVPVVLDVDTGSAHYTSEVVVTNRNTTAASVSVQYTASLGSGSGTATDTIAPGRQLVIPDVMSYLRQKGLSIPEGGSQAGTLLLTFDGITDGDAVAVTVRTTAATAPPLPVGRTGLAYAAIDPASGTDGSLYLYGLRSTDTDRANVAVFNTSATPVSVRVTAFSGSGDGRSQVIVASDPLPAWSWKQYNRVLDGAGFTNGWVRIDRVSGAKTYFSAYAVINDNATNDGSYILPAGGTSLFAYANVPVVVETPAFSSEFVLANSGSATATFRLSYRESLGGTARGTASLTLPAGTQIIQRNAIAWLRSLGIPIGPAGAASYAGSLHVEVEGVTPDQVYAGARTASIASGGGAFGLFTPAFTPGTEGEVDGWIYGLRADAENRSNVAVAHTGGTADGPISLSVQAFDGDAAGAPKGSAVVVTLDPGQWQQLNGFLSQQGVANGWVKITRTAGIANWISYGVINDGGAPGQRTGDGAYVPMSR